MLKCFDFRCIECGHIEEQLYDENDEGIQPCSKCGGDVEKLMSKMSFKLTYNPATDRVGWAYDGYATSQYWSEFNAAKERGEDVVPGYEHDKKYDATDIKNK